MAGKWVFNDFLLEQDGRNRTGDTSLYRRVIGSPVKPVARAAARPHAACSACTETHSVKVSRMQRMQPRHAEDMQRMHGHACGHTWPHAAHAAS